MIVIKVKHDDDDEQHLSESSKKSRTALTLLSILVYSEKKY